MFGGDDSDIESIPSEKEHKKTADVQHGSRKAFKKGVVRPFSHILDPLTSSCDPVADLCCALTSCNIP